MRPGFDPADPEVGVLDGNRSLGVVSHAGGVSARANAAHLSAAYPFPRTSRRRLIEYLAQIEEVLDHPWMRSPAVVLRRKEGEKRTESSVAPFEVDTRALADLAVAIATIVPTPSAEVGEALSNLASRLFWRADSCRHHPTEEGSLVGTAQGYFSVLAWFARGLASARQLGVQHDPDALSVDLALALEAMFRRLGPIVDEYPDAPMSGDTEWGSAAVAVIKLAAHLAYLRSGRTLEGVRSRYDSVLQAQFSKALEAGRQAHHELARIGSWLNALSVLFESQAEPISMDQLPERHSAFVASRNAALGRHTDEQLDAIQRVGVESPIFENALREVDALRERTKENSSQGVHHRANRDSSEPC